MRLFEVADNFASDLEMVLRNLMGRSNTKDASLVLSYESISNLLKNMGYGPIDYNGFKNVYDANPSLQAIVQNFNADKVVVSTDVQPEENPEKVERPTGKSVDQMASSAISKGLTPDL